ncbi:GMC family oxidoreductase N-terminal domain-containing protein [Rhizobium sp. FY34]|uniref:GMC family oxidoreductase n=1 Tax=Rhizobium sp. FY34 TaxID=2562309 RepID=UPI0010C04350|nr:GMC family oxidoreductase N-terminal domain-containing protein [Rhizobium sp. FY34]
MPHFDILIIGAGSAGCVLANRLSADGHRRVCVLEAGGMPTDPDIDDPLKWPFLQGRQYDWAFETTPQAGTAGRVHAWPRGKIFGGSSCLHAMAHVRGHRDDFAVWAEASQSSRWSYDGMLAGFIATEAFTGEASPIRGKDGPLPVWLPGDEVSPLARAYMRAGAEIGAPVLGDHNGENLNGVAVNSLTIRNGKRVSAANAYLFPILPRRNLTVEGGITVHRLLIEGNRISGVETTAGNQDAIYTADTVILAAGAVADPLLLMRSGIGDPEVLAAAGVACRLSRPQVGRNLHDHLLGSGNAYRSKQPIPVSRLQHSESLMYLNAEDPSVEAGRPDVVLGCVIGPSASECLPPLEVGQAYTLLFGVTHPTSRGSLKISGPDISDKPIIDPAYLQTENDRRLFRRALDYARMAGHAKALDDWRAEEVFPGPKPMTETEKDAFIAKAVITHHHPVGTCRMGADQEAVVNADLRVNGLDNLYIVDASVIPAITSGPVHAAVLAIAETFSSSM